MGLIGDAWGEVKKATKKTRDIGGKLIQGDVFGAVEEATGAADAAEKQKEGAEAAAAGARKAGTTFFEDVGGQRDENKNLTNPAVNAANNLPANGPNYGEKLFEGFDQGAAGRNTRNTSQSGQGRQVNVFASEFEAPTNYSTEAMNGLDSGSGAKGINAVNDLANRQAMPPRKTQGEGSLDFFGGLAADGGGRADGRSTAMDALDPSPLEGLAGKRGGQEGPGFSGNAVNRAENFSGGEVGVGEGLTALKGARVDPNEAEFLGRTRAERLRAFEEAPGYAEQELADRKAREGLFGFLADEEEKRIDRMMAARGGYNSGAALRAQELALRGLSAEELKARADLATKAQGLQQERVRDTTAGLAQAEGVRTSRQQINAGIAGDIAGTATAVDANKLGAVDVFGNVSKNADDTTLRSRDQTNAVTSDLDKSTNTREGMKNDLALGGDKNQIDAANVFGDVISDVDTEQGQRDERTAAREERLRTTAAELGVDLDRLEVDAANLATQNDIETAELALEVAKTASDEEFRNLDQRLENARFLDEMDMDSRKLALEYGKFASEEEWRALEKQVDVLTEVGLGLADVNSRLTIAANQGRLDAEMAALDAELAAAGIDMQTRQNTMNTILGAVGIAAGGGGKGGG